MLKYILLLSFTLLLLIVQIVILYLNKNDNTLKFLKINTLSILILFISLVPLIVIDITQYQYELDQMSDYINPKLYDQYMNHEFPFDYIEITYRDYNTYFSGYYINDGDIILAITNDAPDLLIDYLDGLNASYLYVSFSYIELSSLRLKIEKDLDASSYLHGISILIEENQVYLSVSSETYFVENYSSYIDNQMLTVEVTSPYTPNV